MIFYRRRGWLLPPLFLLIVAIPAIALKEHRSLQHVVQVAGFVLAGALTFWLGTRSMREGVATLDRDLRPHEHVFDFGASTPFDSLFFIHARWWAVVFVGAAVVFTAFGGAP